MKIFVGGLLSARRGRFKRAFPGVEFLFASDQESPRVWLRRAKQADVAVIDQARCSHKIVDLLKANDIQCQFADGNLAISTLIERMRDAVV